MRLIVRLIQPFPFQAEPQETVGQLRERLRAHLVSLLEKQHGRGDEDRAPLTVPDVVSLLCCCGGRPDSQTLDLHLSSGGVALLDDGATLAAAGLKDGSEVTVLSRALAARHGESEGVRCVNGAFRALAAKGGAVTAGAEELALKNSTPFPLTCSSRELGELGAGWPLFFEFVCYLVFLCLALCLAHAPALALYGSFDEANLQGWVVDATEQQSMVAHSSLTAGNTGPDGTSSLTPCVCALASVALMLVSAAHMSSRQVQLKQEIDSTEVEPNDFALFIEGLPADAARGKEIREWVEQHARACRSTDVVTVVVGFDIPKFAAQAVTVSKLRKELMECEDDAARRELIQQIETLSKPIATAEELVKFLPNTGYAVAVLRSQSEHRECLQQWDTWREWLAWTLPLPTSLLAKVSETPRFRGTHLVRITRASNPSDYMWENLSTTDSERRRARLKAYAVLAAIFALCVLSVWGMKALQLHLNFGSWFSLLVVLPMVLAAKFAGPIATRRYVLQEKHKTKTQRDLALMVKYTIFAVLVYCVCPLAIVRADAIGQPAPSKDTGYYRDGGLQGTVATLLLVNNFLLPLTTFLGSGVLMRRAILNLGNPLRGTPPLDLDHPPPGLTQARLRRQFEPPDINMARVMSQVMKKFFLGVFFLPMFPLGILYSAGGLMLEYCAYRYQLLRLSKRPYRQSHDVAFGALRLVSAAAGVLGLTQFLLLAPSLAGQGRQLCGWVALIGTLLAAALAVAPEQVSRLLFCAVCLGARADTETDVDYYAAQKAWPKHQKYHTTHAVYLRLEQLMLAAQRRRRPGVPALPWDARTGNFPDPAAGAEAELGAAGAAGAAAAAGAGHESLPVHMGDGGATPAASAPPAETMGPADFVVPLPLADQALWGLAPLLTGGGAEDDADEDDADEGDEEPAATLVGGRRGSAALALEEARCRVPLSMLEAPGAGAVAEETSSSSESTDVSGSSFELTDASPVRESSLLAPGVSAEVRGLTSAPRYNGTACTVLGPDAESDKWLVRLDDGGKARLPGRSLWVASVVLAPGGQARIHGMVRAPQFNGTVAELLEWDAALEKWKVTLCTGAKATVAAGNLVPEGGVGFAF